MTCAEVGRAVVFARASIELLRELLGLAQTTLGKNILSCVYSRLTSFPLKIFACWSAQARRIGAIGEAAGQPR